MAKVKYLGTGQGQGPEIRIQPTVDGRRRQKYTFKRGETYDLTKHEINLLGLEAKGGFEIQTPEIVKARKVKGG